VGFPTDNLEDRIRELCAKAVAAPESESESILSELRAMIHEHVNRARDLAVEAFLKGDDAA
jgi:hypothetical protein